jgi:hypothetical protein
MFHGAKPWIADFKHPHYQAARNALKRGNFQLIEFYLKTSFYLV